ncbi:MAG: 16S rRNA (cytidine(1402)-2'-O)-methyltransferase [Gammaproteobacteria bacterium]|nr:MAG: 16S rRNA (cytidine(1402)-2'-O)-methyltransferase [Gammaproteobacteria bacterium]
MAKGRLFVVATPIGNLSDISERAKETLANVSRIAAEDTRHSRKLLSALGIQLPLVSLHDHNERSFSAKLVNALLAGEDLALISDAGTPMISDPGYHLVRAAQEAQIQVIPIPGPSALITALSVAGLSANRFYFYGFLPDKKAQRQTHLSSLKNIQDTLVFYESGVRIQGCLKDIADCLGGDREAAIGRELTKIHETVERSTVQQLLHRVEEGEVSKRGEFVLMVAGVSDEARVSESEELVLTMLKELIDQLPLGQCAAIVSRVSGFPRKQVYALGLQLKENDN